MKTKTYHLICYFLFALALVLIGTIGSAGILVAACAAEDTMGSAVNRLCELHLIVPLVLGSPLWLSLGLAAIAVIFAFYVVLWSVSVSLWAAFASLAVCAVGGLPAFAVLIARSGAAVLAILAAGMVCAGLAIFCSSAAGPRQRAF